jgi:hypothetical protein
MRHGTFVSAVADYTGGAVVDLDVVIDPYVPGVYALQAKVQYDEDDIRTVQFLVRNVPVAKVTSSDLEEVTFTTWPPTITCGF